MIKLNQTRLATITTTSFAQLTAHFLWQPRQSAVNQVARWKSIPPNLESSFTLAIFLTGNRAAEALISTTRSALRHSTFLTRPTKHHSHRRCLSRARNFTKRQFTNSVLPNKRIGNQAIFSLPPAQNFIASLVLYSKRIFPEPFWRHGLIENRRVSEEACFNTNV